MPLANLEGQKFGELEVISFSGKVGRYPFWLCLCSCGVKKPIAARSLKSGHTKSCGHLSPLKTSVRNRTHGMGGTKVYRAWGDMIQRCTNHKHSSFKDYGGRGITVCPEWLNSFIVFYKDMGDPPLGMTLECKNNNLGYNKDNCKWASFKEQRANQRSKVGV